MKRSKAYLNRARTRVITLRKASQRNIVAFALHDHVFDKTSEFVGDGVLVLVQLVAGIEPSYTPSSVLFLQFLTKRVPTGHRPR